MRTGAENEAIQLEYCSAKTEMHLLENIRTFLELLLYSLELLLLHTKNIRICRAVSYGFSLLFLRIMII